MEFWWITCDKLAFNVIKNFGESMVSHQNQVSVQ